MNNLTLKHQLIVEPSKWGVFKRLSVKRRVTAIELIGNLTYREVFSREALADPEKLQSDYEMLKEYWLLQKGEMAQTEIEDAILWRIDTVLNEAKKEQELLRTTSQDVLRVISTQVNIILEGGNLSKLVKTLPILWVMIVKLFKDLTKQKKWELTILWNLLKVDVEKLKKEEKDIWDVIISIIFNTDITSLTKEKVLKQLALTEEDLAWNIDILVGRLLSIVFHNIAMTEYNKIKTRDDIKNTRFYYIFMYMIRELHHATASHLEIKKDQT